MNKNKILIILIIIISSLLIVALMISSSSPQTEKGEDIENENTTVVEDVKPEKYDSLMAAKSNNSDSVAWIEIPNTHINNEIVQTVDNDFYLRRNENKEDDRWGCYFADYFSELNSSDDLMPNTVIYGHSKYNEDPDGEKFSALFNYLEPEFLEENPNIYITNEEEEMVFEIFAVFFTDVDYYYINPTPNDEDWPDFYSQLVSKNQYIFEEEITQEDHILTLSTCAYRYDADDTGDHRLVVMGKLVDKDEVKDTIEFEINPNPELPN